MPSLAFDGVALPSLNGSPGRRSDPRPRRGACARRTRVSVPIGPSGRRSPTGSGPSPVAGLRAARRHRGQRLADAGGFLRLVRQVADRCSLRLGEVHGYVEAAAVHRSSEPASLGKTSARLMLRRMPFSTRSTSLVDTRVLVIASFHGQQRADSGSGLLAGPSAGLEECGNPAELVVQQERQFLGCVGRYGQHASGRESFTSAARRLLSRRIARSVPASSAVSLMPVCPSAGGGRAGERAGLVGGEHGRSRAFNGGAPASADTRRPSARCGDPPGRGTGG